MRSHTLIVLLVTASSCVPPNAADEASTLTNDTNQMRAAVTQMQGVMTQLTDLRSRLQTAGNADELAKLVAAFNELSTTMNSMKTALEPSTALTTEVAEILKMKAASAHAAGVAASQSATVATSQPAPQGQQGSSTQNGAKPAKQAHQFPNSWPYADKHTHDSKLLCYYDSGVAWRGEYFPTRGERPFPPEQIDTSLCTHLIYIGAAVHGEEIVPYNSITDLEEEGGFGYYKKIAQLKTKDPHLFVMLGVSADETSKAFSDVAAEDAKRKKFSSYVAGYIKKHNFDGVELYWANPTADVFGRPEDKDNFPLLLQELRNAFKEESFLLSVIVHGNKEVTDKAFDSAKIAQHVDWIRISGYNLVNKFENKLFVGAALDSADGYSLKANVKYFQDKGVPNDKLVVGLGALGYGFKLDGENDTMSGMIMSVYNQPYLAYHEICLYLNDEESGWKETWDDASSTPLATRWKYKITYDNEESMQLKVRHAVESKLAGVALHSIDLDDYAGVCTVISDVNDAIRHRFPILKAINEALKRFSDVKTYKTQSVSEPKHKLDIHVFMEGSVY